MYMCIRYMVYFIHRHPSSNCYLALCKQLRSILYVQQVDIVQLHSIISVYTIGAGIIVQGGGVLGWLAFPFALSLFCF